MQPSYSSIHVRVHVFFLQHLPVPFCFKATRQHVDVETEATFGPKSQRVRPLPSMTAKEAKLSKSISLPGLYKIGTAKPRGFSGNARTTTLGFKIAGNLKSAVDLKRTATPTDHSRHVASLLKTGGWRTYYQEEQEDVPVKERACVVLYMLTFG